MNIISYVTELLKAKVSVKIAEYNLKIDELSNKNSSEIAHHVIGFEVPEVEGDEEDSDD